MGNTTSFNNVTQIVETRGGLLLDASTFTNMSIHEPLNLAFDTVWVVDAGDVPLGPYEAVSSVTYESLSGRWSGPEKGKRIYSTTIGAVGVTANARTTGSADDIWWLTWSPEEGEDVKYTLVPWVDMSYGELPAFQDGFNMCLKGRLDSPDALPLSEDPILMDALEGIERKLVLV
ncbi:hypothetical protein BJV78DRAFT_425567 [Lactifluus subvellereus]|nr:hypothetical protein BJV78DRAFT_425567 [Lactifluus subvellereus]